MRKRIRNLLVVLVALFGVYVLVGFFVVPVVVKSQLVAHVEQKLAHRLSLGEVRFNPLALTAELADFDLRDPQGGALFAFKRLLVNFEVRSLIDRAWTFAEASIDEPVLNVEIRKGGVLNFAALIEALRSPEKKEDTPLPRLQVRRLAITQGRVDLADHDQPEPATLRLAPVAFELTDLSTLPDHRSPYTLSARTAAGESIQWGGELSLAPIASSGKIALTGWKVATLTAFFAERLNIAPAGGQLDIAARYEVAYSQGRVDVNVIDLGVKLQALSIAPPGGGEPVLALSDLSASGGRLDLAKRTVSIERITAAAPIARVSIAADGAANWAGLVTAVQTAPSAAPAKTAPAAPAGAWKLTLPAVEVTGAALTFVNQAAGAAAQAAFSDGALAFSLNAELGEAVRAELQGLRLSAAALAVRLGADALRVSKVALAGNSATISSQSDALTVNLNDLSVAVSEAGVRLGAGQSDVATFASLEVSAKAVETQMGPATPSATLDGLTMTLAGASVRDPAAGSELARLDRARLQGARVSLAERRVEIERLTLADGAVGARIGKNGQLDWASLLPPRVPSPSAQAATSPAPGWNIALEHLELQGLEAGFVDEREATPVKVELAGIAGRASKLGTDPKVSAQVELTAQVKGGGRLALAGSVNPHTPRADLKVKVTELSLAPAQPYLARATTLRLASGHASADVRVRYGGARADGANLLFEGSLGVAKLVLEETDTGQPFLSADGLTTSDVKLTLGPDRLDIGELRVDGFAGKLLIAEDQSVNLTKVIRRSATAGGPPAAAKPSSAPPAPPAAQPAGEPFPISIARIRVDRTRLEFSDLTLRPQFATRMHDLQGVVTGVSTARTSRARVQLEGRVDEYGLARIQGEISPFQPRVLTDIEMVFRNVEMTSLTPYSAKFAGYRIASGLLNLDLQYKIKDSQLTAENKIVLERLELGERVDSPNALSLPLELALALLKDSDGRIDIGLPIRGSLEDPDFSYASLVWKATGNLLTRIVTAPFRMIASLFGAGGSEEKLDAVEFDPGSDRLLPPERQKLKTIAEALKKRPQLNLGVKPAFATTEDTAAMKSLLARREIVTRMGIQLRDNEDPGPVDTNNERAQQAIEALFAERFSSAAVRDLRAGLAKSAQADAPGDGKTRPTTPAPAPGALQQAMLERIVAQAPVPETALTELATRRGEAIRHELTESNGVDAARVTIAAPTAAEAASSKAVAARLDLAPAR